MTQNITFELLKYCAETIISTLKIGQMKLNKLQKKKTTNNHLFTTFHTLVAPKPYGIQHKHSPMKKKFNLPYCN